MITKTGQSALRDTAILTFVLAVSLSASTYYISPAGSDGNPGSSAQPFRTVQKGVDAAAAGDTVILMDGTYDNNGVQSQTMDGNTIYTPVSISKAGTASAYIVIKAQHKWGATLDCGTTSTYVGCDAYVNLGTGAAYLLIQDLVITRGYWAGIWNNGDGHHIILKGNRIEYIGRHSASSAQGMAGVYSGGSTHDLTFDGNMLHDIGRTGGTYYDKNDHGLYLKSTNTTIMNNIFYAPISGWGVQTAKGFTGMIANNTFSGMMTVTANGQIVLWDNNPSVIVRNNVFYNPRGSAIHLSSFSTNSCAIDTNIIYGTGVGLADGTLPSACTTGNNRTNTDPMFVSAASPYDFHLQAGSPAIDTGTAISVVANDFGGVSRPQGAGYDVGAYEYGSTASSAPVISAVAASSITSSSATITWMTDKPADSLVQYGTGGYTSSTYNATLATQHAATLSGLAALTTYHYRVQSRDGTGNVATSGDYTFTTAAGSISTFAFSLAASPGSVSLAKGQSATATIAITLVSGSAQSVSLSATGLPSGVRAGFSYASCVPTCSSVLTLSASSSATGGTYQVNVVGAGGGATASASLPVTIADTGSGLAAWWTFNDGRSSTASDSSGNGNTGWLKGGTTWVSGSYGTAIAFNGTNGYVSVKESASLEISSAMTVSFWLLGSDVPGVDQRIVSKNYSWEVKLNGSQHLPQLSAGNGYAALNYPLPMGTWQHVVFTFANGIVKGYVNGISQPFLVNTFAQNQTLPLQGYGLNVGASASTSNFAKGVIDDVRIYGRALSDNEVQVLRSQTAH